MFWLAGGPEIAYPSASLLFKSLWSDCCAAAGGAAWARCCCCWLAWVFLYLTSLGPWDVWSRFISPYDCLGRFSLNWTYVVSRLFAPLSFVLQKNLPRVSRSLFSPPCVPSRPPNPFCWFWLLVFRDLLLLCCYEFMPSSMLFWLCEIPLLNWTLLFAAKSTCLSMGSAHSADCC